MDRIYHRFENWEDFKYGMYETSTCYLDASSIIKENELLLKTPEFLREAMLYVSHNWPISSEQNLTNSHRNRQAWLGQAACCLFNGSPEYLTKKAWNNLNHNQQNSANNVADCVIQDWENKHRLGCFNGKN